jgi:hypothetical protein
MSKRWRGKLKVLYLRHKKLVKEMQRRGYKHQSPLDKRLARGNSRQNILIKNIAKQKEILKRRNCKCYS